MVSLCVGIWVLTQPKDAFFSVLGVVLIAIGLLLSGWTVLARLKLEEAAGRSGVDE